MSIDLFAQMNFSDDEAWKVFTFNHGFVHENYSRLILNQFNVQIPKYDLYTVRLSDNMETQNWLQTHDQVHKYISSITGLGESPDLETVDLKDKSQFYDWMYYHQLIHDQIDTLLGAQ
jgi:hypothetical protein